MYISKLLNKKNILGLSFLVGCKSLSQNHNILNLKESGDIKSNIKSFICLGIKFKWTIRGWF